MDAKIQSIRHRDAIESLHNEVYQRAKTLLRRKAPERPIPLDLTQELYEKHLKNQQPIYIGRESLKSDQKKLKQALEKSSTEIWKQRWQTSLKGRDLFSLNPSITQKTLELYKDRTKAASSILIQLKTQKIGLQAFLYRQKVPGFDRPTCPSCQETEETPRHFLLECRTWKHEREQYLKPLDRVEGLEKLLNTKEGATRAILFTRATGRLEQYSSIDLAQLS